jgi:very-short-patch-repair endonuclease
MAIEPDEARAAAGPRAVLSHETAAELLGIELRDPPTRRLTVPRNRSRLRIDGWTVVRADLQPNEVELHDDRRRTNALRTVLDLCWVLFAAAACVAADSALRQGLVSMDELTSALSRSFGRGCDRLRRLPALLDARAESVLETLLRLVLLEAGLVPVTQHVIRDRRGAFVARVDVCWPDQRLVVEADGFAFHSDRAAYRRDRARLNELERLGWRVLRFTWEDVHQRPEFVVALVRECLAAAA